MRPRGSKLQPHWQSAAVPAALHVEAEHAGGRRLLRGAGAHFVPAFGLPFQTKTTLDSLTAPRRTGHMDTHRAQNAHSPHVAPRVWRRCSWRPCEQRGSAQRGRCAVPLRTVAAPSGIAPRATVTRRSACCAAPRHEGNGGIAHRGSGILRGHGVVHAWFTPGRWVGQIVLEPMSRC